MTYAYIRVSTQDQNEARQLDAIAESGYTVDRTIIDKQSGKDFLRNGWCELMGILRAGDLVLVKSIDRLGRNYDEIIEQWRHITKEIGADIVVLDMPLLDTRSGRDLTGRLVADIVLQLLSYVAQTERENIRQRQAEGIASARARGVHLGRPHREVPEFESYAARVATGSLSVAAACRELNISRSQWYRMAKEA